MHFINASVPWELNPQPLCSRRNALLVEHIIEVNGFAILVFFFSALLTFWIDNKDDIWMTNKSKSKDNKTTKMLWTFYCVCASREREIFPCFIWAGQACICVVRCLLEAILQGDVILSHSWCCWSRAFTVHRHGSNCYCLWLLILYHSLCCSSHRRYKDSLQALNDALF